MDSHPLPAVLVAEVRVLLHLNRYHGSPQGFSHKRHKGGGGSSTFFCSFSFVGCCYFCCCFFQCSFFSCCWGGASGSSGVDHRGSVDGDTNGDAPAAAASVDTDADAARRWPQEIQGRLAMWPDQKARQQWKKTTLQKTAGATRRALSANHPTT